MFVARRPHQNPNPSTSSPHSNLLPPAARPDPTLTSCLPRCHTDIAKYITKAEPHGFFKDSAELEEAGQGSSSSACRPRGRLRDREDMPPAERYLNARVVSMPEAVHRTWGFDMRAGTGVTHLVTQPPHLRMRALARQPARDEKASDEDSSESDDDDDNQLKFSDGTVEQYENRPADEAGDDYWATMLYPNFHRRCAPQHSSPIHRASADAAIPAHSSSPLARQVPSRSRQEAEQDRSHEARCQRPMQVPALHGRRHAARGGGRG